MYEEERTDEYLLTKLPWKVEENIADNSFFVMVDHDNYDDIVFLTESEHIADYIVDLHNISTNYAVEDFELDADEVIIAGCKYFLKNTSLKKVMRRFIYVEK